MAPKESLYNKDNNNSCEIFAEVPSRIAPGVPLEVARSVLEDYFFFISSEIPSNGNF